MKVSAAFPSKYLSEPDLQGIAHPLTISSVTMETLDDGQKPIVYFKGAQKGLVLNITNAKVIGNIHGDEMDGWVGKVIELYPTQTEFRGEMKPCIRVRQAQLPAVQAPAPEPEIHDPLNDSVPF